MDAEHDWQYLADGNFECSICGIVEPPNYEEEEDD